MKIIIDNAIPFINGVFEPYCKVEYIEGDSITKESVKDATALLIRTRTHCNKELLEGSQVRHIASATIGFDHIDTQYCADKGIEVSTAAGCNAYAVLQWFGAVAAYCARKEGWKPEQKVLGVVGVGNVGSLVSHYAKVWGFNVLRCDPPRFLREGGDFVSFEEVASKADIITFHTPLDHTTQHLFNYDIAQIISPSCTIINSSRGKVVDTKALLNSGNNFVLDVWEDEPNINDEALQKALLATPHIAGYSIQGKANASMIAVRNIAKALSLPLDSWCSEVQEVQHRDVSWEELCQTIDNVFDIESQSAVLKGNKELFESLRNNYNYRNEYF